MRPAFGLPDIRFVETDAAEVERRILSTYEEITGRKLYPGNPERLFLESLAYIIAQQNFLIDYAAKMNLLAYARGGHLDHLGALLGVSRLSAQPARTTLRFEIAEPLSFPVVIPKGARATPDGKLFFATLSEAQIEPGKTSVEVEAECLEAGTRGNGFLPGQINRLVDPVAYVVKVENTTVSLGGADTESDEHYRERIRLAPESFSNAGSRGAYEFWAKSAHQDIADVSVWSPSPGEVNVCILMKDGGLPSQEILDLVTQVLSSEKVRPLTDQVTVQAPQTVSYNIDLTYYVYREYEALVSQIQQAVTEAVNAYIQWQKTKLGRDITPSVLVDYVQSVAGVKRVSVVSPAYQPLEPWQVAREGTVTVTYGGLEDA
ncbi:MAG TPA: baseplate J/gp47 family protein [Thermosulfurimonas dismutans]|uniref:Baseplate J/gp47 family protein n=1 Tax=Thermosulfurimonas dismutans TaxID=999894 RepID=A0A7C3H164_9BACT|nr:baseplate J/gp47 family protein [Thermosulfurimonas dismutans]